MLDSLNKKLKKMRLKGFLPIGCTVGMLSDLLLAFYVSTIMLPKLVSLEAIKKAMTAKGMNISMISTSDLLQFKELVISTVGTGLFVFLVYNFIVYLLAMRKTKWAIKYLEHYALSTVILSIVELVLYIYNGGFNFYTFVTTLGYLFLWYGLYYFKKNPVK